MSTKRLMKKRTCTKKIRYETQPQAWAAMRSLAYSKGTSFLLHVYCCPYSGQRKHWHVGHIPHKTRQSMRAKGQDV